MAYYSWAGLSGYSMVSGTPAPPIAGYILEIKSGVTDYPLISEIGLSTIVANGGSAAVVLSRATVPALNPVTQFYSFVPEDGISALSGISVSVLSSNLPTTLSAIRRATILGTNSPNNPVVFSFPRGYKLAPSTSLYLNVSNNFEQAHIWVEVDA